MTFKFLGGESRKGGGVRVGTYLSLSVKGRGWGGGGRLFEAGRLLTFSAFRMGVYLRLAIIQVWALFRINTVSPASLSSPPLSITITFVVVTMFFIIIFILLLIIIIIIVHHDNIFIITIVLDVVVVLVWMLLILMHMRHFKHQITWATLYKDACKRNISKLVFYQEWVKSWA